MTDLFIFNLYKYFIIATKNIIISLYHKGYNTHTYFFLVTKNISKLYLCTTQNSHFTWQEQLSEHFHLTNTTHSGDHPFTRPSPERRRGDARSRNTNVRPMPKFDKSVHECGRLRVHLNRDTGICYQRARTSDQVFSVLSKGWRSGAWMTRGVGAC